MMTRDEIIQRLREHSGFLAAEYGVRKIGLFGSYAGERAEEDSDVDLVVEFDRSIGFRFIELAEYLEKLLGKPVDLLTPAGIQNIRLGEVAQTITKSILYV
jgi:predicted nucleotidyltransferase